MPEIPHPIQKDSLRLTLYLNRKKHAELFEFLVALPDGTMPTFVRDVLEKYIQSGGFSSPLPPQNRKPEGGALLPLTTLIRGAQSKPHALELLPDAGARQPHTENRRP
jgi:hypothetical protein